MPGSCNTYEFVLMHPCYRKMPYTMGAGILGSKETFVHALVSKQRRREIFPRKGEVFVLWGKTKWPPKAIASSLMEA